MIPLNLLPSAFGCTLESLALHANHVLDIFCAVVLCLHEGIVATGLLETKASRELVRKIVVDEY